MPRKDRILLFIDEYMQAQGCAPTIREICANEEIKTTSLVYRHLLRLEKRGLIYRAYRFKSRSFYRRREGLCQSVATSTFSRRKTNAWQ